MKPPLPELSPPLATFSPFFLSTLKNWIFPGLIGLLVLLDSKCSDFSFALVSFLSFFGPFRSLSNFAFRVSIWLPLFKDDLSTLLEFLNPLICFPYFLDDKLSWNVSASFGEGLIPNSSPIAGFFNASIAILVTNGFFWISNTSFAIRSRTFSFSDVFNTFNIEAFDLLKVLTRKGATAEAVFGFSSAFFWLVKTVVPSRNFSLKVTFDFSCFIFFLADFLFFDQFLSCLIDFEFLGVFFLDTTAVFCFALPIFLMMFCLFFQ